MTRPAVVAPTRKGSDTIPEPRMRLRDAGTADVKQNFILNDSAKGEVGSVYGHHMDRLVGRDTSVTTVNAACGIP